MLIIIRDSVQTLQTSELPPVVKAYKTLPQFIDNTEVHINKLLNFIKTDVLKGPGKVSFRAWNKQTEAKLAEFKLTVDDAHQKLHTAISSANL